MDRLRIAVRRPNVKKSVYTNNTLPEGLRPYVEKAIEDLRTSENPTIAMQYLIESDMTLSVWFEPKYRTELHEPESWPYKWSGMSTPKPRKIKVRVWP